MIHCLQCWDLANWAQLKHIIYVNGFTFIFCGFVTEIVITSYACIWVQFKKQCPHSNIFLLQADDLGISHRSKDHCLFSIINFSLVFIHSSRLCFVQVNVMNINYVQSHSQAPTCERAKQSRLEGTFQISSWEEYIIFHFISTSIVFQLFLLKKVSSLQC